MREVLLDWVAAAIGASGPGTVARIGTGHSRAMYRLTYSDGSRVVVRMEQGGVFGTSGREEAAVMRDLADAGFPVAPIVAEEPTGEVTGQPFFVMAHLDGTAPEDERALDEATAISFVLTLRSLHDLDAGQVTFDDGAAGDPDDVTHRQIDRWRDVYRSASPVPIPLLEEAAAWLHHHAPSPERVCVVHGDAGPGNFVHDGSRVVALTDFEFTHLGDPAEDWSFCLAMRGARTMSRDRWLALFAEHAGVAMTAARWRYWEAFNLFKGACANRTCLTLFEDGVNRAPNMAIIGTALHQLFLRRLVDLVDGPAPDPPGDRP